MTNLFQRLFASDGAADGVAEGLWDAVGEGERLCSCVDVGSGIRRHRSVEWVA